MSVKITIEVDGTSEQALAPALERTAARLMSAPPPMPANATHENVAYLHQTIQQLMAQNQQLLAGVAQRQAVSPREQISQKEIALGTDSLPAQRVPESKVAVVPPSLPQRYRQQKSARTLSALKQLAQMRVRQLWQFKGYVLVFLLFSLMTYGIVLFTPKVLNALFPPATLTDSAGEVSKPGTVQTGAAAEEAPVEETPKLPDTPGPPASKAGSHPPPPPAFRAQ